MKIGLYFGSFNPIHIGHLIIANFVAHNTEVDQVWFVVSPHNPLKKSSTLLNEYHRLHLVQLAIEQNPHFKASDIEFRLPRPSYTIDTLTYLREQYQKHEFVIVMGSDSFQNINRWKNNDLLIKNYSFYIFQRPGYIITNNRENVTTLKAPLLEISSTEIRIALKKEKTIRYMVSEKVREEIEKSGYYK